MVSSLEAHAAGTPQRHEVQPHQNRQPQKGQYDLRRLLRPAGDHQLHAGQHLKHRQSQEGGQTGHRTLRPALFLQFFPFRHGLGQKQQRHAAQGDGVPQLHRGRVRYLLAVDGSAALGTQVIYRPLSILSPAQRRVLAGDAGVIQKYVRGLSPSDDIFPVGQLQRRAVGQAQLAPDLRRMGHLQQRPKRPEQNEKRHHREQKTDECRIPAAHQRMGRQKRGDTAQQRLQRRRQALHIIRLLSESFISI